jgi:hypothetical protein
LGKTGEAEDILHPKKGLHQKMEKRGVARIKKIANLLKTTIDIFAKTDSVYY